ncbi:ribosomal protein S18-alanine N-acetyltransferase [Pseudomonadota bacterium]
MKIVEASPAHAEVLARLHAESFPEPWSLEAMAGALATPGALGLVAQNRNNEPLGFLLVRSGGGEAEVLTIATRPQARRSGVARALMDAGLERVRAAGAETVFLEVAEDNVAAKAFYENVGFREVGRRKKYYARADGERIDAVVMRLSFS